MNANFEQYARKQISTHEVAVDTEALWAEIYPQVRPKKDNRRLLWFLFFGLVGGLLSAGLIYQNTGTITLANPSNNANEVALATALEDKKVEQEITTAVEENKKETQLLEQEEAKLTAIASPGKVKASPKKGNQSSTSKAKQLPSTVEAVPTAGIESVNAMAMIEETTSDQVVVMADAEETINSLPVFSMDETLNSLPLKMPLLLDAKTDLPLTLEQKEFSDDFLANSKKKKKRRNSMFRNLRYGLGLYTGISRSNTDLEAKNEASEAHLLLRTNSEKQLETLHLGFNALVETEHNGYLRLGAEYTRIGSLFSRQSEQIVIDSSQIGVIEIQINSVTGDTNFIEGPIITTRKTSFVKKTYNYFHLIDVPVIFGYNFGSADDTWRIGVEAGIFANIAIKSKGEIGLEDGTFYDIGDDPNKWYTNNIGISPHLGINIAYNVDQNIQAHFTPSFRFNSLFSTNNNPFRERHANLGVQAGVRYFFD